MLRLVFNIWLVTAALLLSATASLALSNCIGSYKASKWTNCSGTYVYTNGDVYVGGWKDGKFHGHGTLTWANGDKYIGGWKNGKFYGHSITLYANGIKSAGYYVDGPSPQKLGLHRNGNVVSLQLERSINKKFYCKAFNSVAKEGISLG